MVPSDLDISELLKLARVSGLDTSTVIPGNLVSPCPQVARELKKNSFFCLMENQSF